jgi:hypothetical protein
MYRNGFHKKTLNLFLQKSPQLIIISKTMDLAITGGSMGNRAHRLITAGFWAIFTVTSIADAETINISGTVKRTNGTAIKGATIWLANQKVLATTDANGAFLLSGQALQQISSIRCNVMSGGPQMKNNVLYFGVLFPLTEVRVDVFNLTGRHVASLINRCMAQGNYRLPTDAVFLPAEIYCLRLQVGPAVFFFKMLIVSQRGPNQLNLSTVGLSQSATILAKGTATSDSLIAGCADCIPESRAIDSYSGVYAFTLATAAYSPPKYIINSSAKFAYASDGSDNGTTYMSEINGKNCFDNGGSRALTIRNFIYAGDSVRYVVETDDSISWRYYYNTWPILYSDTLIYTVTTQSYSDAATSPRLSYWDKTFTTPPTADCSEFIRKATFNGTPVTISELYTSMTLALVSKFSNEIGLLFAASNGSFTLTQVNGVIIYDTTLRYEQFHPVFNLDNDSCYGFVNNKLLYRTTVFNPDSRGYSLTLLQQPQGMTVTHDSVCWLPATVDAGTHEAKIQLIDANGVSDTLSLHISVINPGTRWVYSTWSHINSGTSKVNLGYIDSSKTMSQYIFGKYDSVYYPSSNLSNQTDEISFISNCSVDSALTWFWENHIYVLKYYSGTERKALYKADTVSVKTVNVDAVSSASSAIPTFYHSFAVFSRELGLISYNYSAIGGVYDSTSMYLKEYNGQPFDTANIVYLK